MHRTLLTRLIVATLLSLSLFPGRAHAGPWTKNLGQYYGKLSVGGYFANGFRDAAGVFQEGVRYASVSPALYVEAGVWDGLQLMAYLPYLAAQNSFDRSEQNTRAGGAPSERAGSEYARLSLGDTIVGVQWSSPFWALPHALRFEAKLPLYDVNPPEGVERDNFPAPGDGQLDLTLWASLGASLDAVPLYWFAELGHQFRTEAFLIEEPRLSATAITPEYDDSLRWFGQAGYRFLDNKYAILNFQGVWPYAAGAFTKGWVNLGAALFYPVGSRGFALEASFDQAVKVVNAAQGTSVSCGVSISK